MQVTPDLKTHIADIVVQMTTATALTQINNFAFRLLQPSPFVELLKMAAHAGKVPSCESCKYWKEAVRNEFSINGKCLFGFEVDESSPDVTYSESDYFCSQWEPVE